MSKTITIDEAAMRRLSGTAASNPEGNPLVMHHGTVHLFSEFGKTVDLGYHFGTREQAQARLDTMPKSALGGGSLDDARIVSVALAVKRPLLLLDDPGTWQPGFVSSSVAKLLGIKPARGATLENVRSWLDEAGYDALVYRNMVESARKSRCVEFSWLVLRPEQIVMLGEDVKAETVSLPPALRGGPGFDPVARAEEIGGMRYASGRLQRAVDRKAFHAAFVEVMADLYPDVADEDYCGVGHKWVCGEAGAGIEVVMSSDLGRVRFWAQGVVTHDGFEESAAHVSCDGSTYGLQPGIRPTAPIFWCEWTPGEPMSAVLFRCREMVESASLEFGLSTAATPSP